MLDICCIEKLWKTRISTDMSSFSSLSSSQSLRSVSEALPSSSQILKFLASAVKEFDTTSRPAKVYLMSRPVERFGEGHDAAQHSALVFEFTDNSIRIIEGNNVDGTLKPFFFKQSPPSYPGTTYKPLGVIDTSPGNVREIAVNNRLNDVAYSGKNDSAKWVEEVVTQLGGEILKRMGMIQSVEEVKPLFQIAFGASKSSASSWPFSSSSR